MNFIIILLLGVLAFPPKAYASENTFEEEQALQAWLQELNEDVEPTAETMALVNIRNGTVRGFTSQASVGLHKVYHYLGIPFAKPPVGELRFQAPQPYEGWGDGIYNATKNPKSCPQSGTNLTKADEDCLYLSIYSRRQGGGVGTGPLLPVVFFIHGGGFVLGQSAGYGGYKLLADEIVLVVVQYRLGPFGFLYTGDDTVSANNGMKDMVQGLRWVQENIQAFGGDPGQVTIMGESAGSASALYMLISPLAQGLFHKVVAMSGTPLQEWAIDRNPVESTKRVAKHVNCPTESSVELVNCLREMDWMPIARAGIDVLMEEFKSFKIQLSGSTPAIEGNVPGAFLPDDPLKLMLEGPLPDVPVMLGSVQHEGILPLAACHYLILQPNETECLNNRTYMRDFFLGDLLTTYNVNERKDGASVSQSMAVGFLRPGSNRTDFTDIQYELLDMVSAVFMKAPILRTADILSMRLSSVYLYSFEYYNQYGTSLYDIAFKLIVPIIGGKRPLPKGGISHADDLLYMFRLPFLFGPRDIAFSRTYCELFINFIISGTPTPQPTEKYEIWPKYDIDDQYYMKLAENFRVMSDYSASWRQGMPGEN